MDGIIYRGEQATESLSLASKVLEKRRRKLRGEEKDTFDASQ